MVDETGRSALDGDAHAAGGALDHGRGVLGIAGVEIRP